MINFKLTSNTGGPRAASSTDDAEKASVLEPADVAAAPKRTTKQSLVVNLLKREGEISLSAVADATGWLLHSARAALTNLRKRGHSVVQTKVDGETRYGIAMELHQ